MRSLAVLALLVLSVAGCGTPPAPPSQYGNFVQGTTVDNATTLVNDAMKKLVVLYPPARTRFELQQATPDMFGIYLVKAMRAKGYAVEEYQAAMAGAKGQSDAPLAGGMSLSYIVDQSNDMRQYRVTLVIDRLQSLDRVYQVQDGTLLPAGYWVRRN